MLLLKKEQKSIKISSKIANSGTQKLDSARMMGVWIFPSPLLIMSFSSFFSSLLPCTPLFPFIKLSFLHKSEFLTFLEFLCQDQTSSTALVSVKERNNFLYNFPTPPSINPPVIQTKMFVHLEGATVCSLVQ